MKKETYEKISKDFFKKHPAYSLCSFIYFLFAGWWFGGFAIFARFDTEIMDFVGGDKNEVFWFLGIWAGLAFVYVMSVELATSRVGESIMRMFNGIRRLETSEEKEYLRPIFDEVYAKAKANNPELEDFNIDIYVIDSMAVNACAVGLRTVAVTKGAIKAFSTEQLKGIISHEIAHILNADTFAKIKILIGNGIFTLCIFMAKLVWWLIGRVPAFRNPMQAVSRLLDILVFAFLFPMMIVMAISDRKAERRADSYAVEIGYGEDLVGALYVLEKISLKGLEGMIAKLLSTHPRVTSRIEALEVQLGIQEDER
jgi:heat shock protein HtpX